MTSSRDDAPKKCQQVSPLVLPTLELLSDSFVKLSSYAPSASTYSSSQSLSNSTSALHTTHKISSSCSSRKSRQALSYLAISLLFIATASAHIVLVEIFGKLCRASFVEALHPPFQRARSGCFLRLGRGFVTLSDICWRACDVEGQLADGLADADAFGRLSAATCCSLWLAKGF